MESTRADPRIGLVLNGRYRITAPLGEGGMGTVYRGERLQLRRPVAIKFLHSPYADAANFVARFEREARAMSMLSHPYCVSVLDFGVHQAPYIIMDFVEGSTLRQVLDDSPLTAQRALHITRQVLIGLAHAHAQGVVHRDIKPANIMLSEATGLGDHVRIFDFGLAKLHDPELHGEASIAAIVGTPAYMAPEQARADRVDGRADLYAAGVVLFEMLTRRKPFEADTAYELLCLQRDKAPPRLRELVASLSPELELVVDKALAKDPKQRYQTAVEFGEALEATPEWAGAAAPFAAGEPALAATQIGPVTGPTRVTRGAAPTPNQRRRRTRRWPSVALLLLAAFAFGSWKLDLHPRALFAGRTAVPAHAIEGNGPQAVATPEPAQVRDDAVGSVPVVDEPALPREAAPAAEAVDAAGAAAQEPADEAAELSEAALAAADEALNDREEREVVLSSAEDRREPPAQTVADVRRLIARGKSDAAIRAVQQLRRKRPRDAQLPFLLGNVYFEKGWMLDGLAKYRETIALSSGYRKNARIQRDAVRALGFDRAYPRARALLVRDVGRAALPTLRRASRADGSQVVRRRANSIVKQLQR
jgi:eukaryotic-like serine/threonine-protein kinase